MGVLEDVDGVLRRAAEFPRQRPFGAVIGAEDAAEDLRAGRGARDLLDLLAGVDREEADAAREGRGDVALLLDGVAVGDAVGRGAGGEAMSISATLAQSKDEPSSARSFSTSGSGFALTA